MCMYRYESSAYPVKHTTAYCEHVDAHVRYEFAASKVYTIIFLHFSNLQMSLTSTYGINYANYM